MTALNFAPIVGGQATGSNTNNVENIVKKAVNLAQSTKNMANEATNGQAEKYLERAKETAQDFANDVKQVTKDKTTSSFLTKNKYRNVKIIAAFLVITFILSGLFGESKGEKLAKAALVPQYSDCKIKSADEITGSGNWHVYRVKFISPDKEEYSALVEVSVVDNYAKIVKSGVYRKARYDELNARIEEFKILYNALNK